MFSTHYLDYLEQFPYDVIRANCHDITVRSRITGHEWVIVSNYSDDRCYILHRHSVRDPFHHQRGRYASLASAMEYIARHDEWYYSIQKRVIKRNLPGS